MRRFGLLLAAVASLAGCGGGSGGKSACGASNPCGAGFYCARTPDGSVCWEDAVKPVISAAAAACADTTCRRDSVLRVTATVSDESAMGTVNAVLDVDPDHPRRMELVSGADYAVDIPLAQVPFPYFEHAIGVTVKAADEAENAADDADCGSETVTRARWTAPLRGAGNVAFPLFSPALLPDGRVVVAGSDGSVHFVSKTGTETRAAVSIGSVVNSPPSVSADAIWLGAQNGSLHKLSFDGSEIGLSDCTTSAPLVGPPAVDGSRVLAASSGIEFIVARSSNSCAPSNLAASATTAPALDRNGKVLVVTGSAIRMHTLAANSVLSADWTGVPPAPGAPSVGSVSQPLAIDALNAIWTTALNGDLYRTTSAGTNAHVMVDPAVSISSTGSIVLPDGSVVLGDQASVLRRAAASGGVSWTTSAALSGHPRIPLALRGAEPSLVVPTSDGWLFDVKVSDGTVLWSNRLSTQSLEPANIWTEPGASTSTAYLAGADGNLYAIIVDGALDTSAPWPKAFHDPQNTSNAGVTP